MIVMTMRMRMKKERSVVDDGIQGLIYHLSTSLPSCKTGEVNNQSQEYLAIASIGSVRPWGPPRLQRAPKKSMPDTFDQRRHRPIKFSWRQEARLFVRTP